ICKMIRALRNLGMLDLSVRRVNRRARRISLTRLGRKRFARVLKAIRKRKVEAAVRSAWRVMEFSRFEQWATIAELIEALDGYSRGLRDYTRLYKYLNPFRGALAAAFANANGGADFRW